MVADTVEQKCDKCKHPYYNQGLLIVSLRVLKTRLTGKKVDNKEHPNWFSIISAIK